MQFLAYRAAHFIIHKPFYVGRFNARFTTIQHTISSQYLYSPFIGQKIYVVLMQPIRFLGLAFSDIHRQ